MANKRFEVLFSIGTVALHLKAANELPTKATRLIELPREGAIGEDDSNVRALRAMAIAGNAFAIHQMEPA